MKKYILFAVLSAVSILLWSAQEILTIHLKGGQKESMRTEEIDTIRFKRNEILIEGDQTKKYKIADVDSATFTSNTIHPKGDFSDTVGKVVIEMVYVEGGTYTRGCDDCAEQDKKYETPSHQVTVSDFFI